jgi:nitroreductase
MAKEPLEKTVSRMSVLEAIKTRRSIPQMKPDPVPRELIMELLEAAVWTPNHKLTEPWQFFVLEGEAKRRFAEIRRDFRRSTLPNPDMPEVQPALERLYQETFATPVIIVVTSHVQDNPEMREEDFWATFGATYAFMLGAWSVGVGTYFRTGGFRDYPPLRAMLGLPVDRRIIGVLSVGYPTVIPQKRRTPVASKTVWLDHPAGANAAAD